MAFENSSNPTFHQLSLSQRVLIEDYVQWLEEMIRSRIVNFSTIRMIRENLLQISFEVLSPDTALGIRNAIEDLENALKLGEKNPHTFSWIQDTLIILSEVLRSESKMI